MIDLALTGEIYTKGSWGLSAQSTYRKRYKFNGHFNINYLKTIYGEKGIPTMPPALTSRSYGTTHKIPRPTPT